MINVTQLEAHEIGIWDWIIARSRKVSPLQPKNDRETAQRVIKSEIRTLKSLIINGCIFHFPHSPRKTSNGESSSGSMVVELLIQPVIKSFFKTEAIEPLGH